MVSSMRSGGHHTPCRKFSGVEDKNGVFTKILRSSNSRVEGNGSLGLSALSLQFVLQVSIFPYWEQVT